MSFARRGILSLSHRKEIKVKSNLEDVQIVILDLSTIVTGLNICIYPEMLGFSKWQYMNRQFVHACNTRARGKRIQNKRAAQKVEQIYRSHCITRTSCEIREREKIQPAFCAVFLNLFTILPTSSDTEYVHPTQHTSCNLDVHHDQGGNETVQTQDLGENQDQNHTDVQFWLLGSSSDTGVTDDTNGKTSC